MGIGELASKSGRSVHTIRWYEAQRLMPLVSRDKGRRRVYSELHVGWLELLDRLKRTGMSIREMREYTALAKQGHSTLEARVKLLCEHGKRVEARVKDLEESILVIDGKIKFYSEWIITRRRPPMGRSKQEGGAA
jgi:DNA-binding transcriptional MerR regulator